MAKPDRRNIIIGARADNRGARQYPIPGTRTLACEKCGKPTLFLGETLTRKTPEEL